ncbi:MAG TPA: vitamin K epoxide reductase family protein [Gemmatimonadales bacterium]|nr:vitamin K epoxide reductase family protein [Gemmatimonadales bacterium]
MKYRMASTLLSLCGVLLAAYLYLYKTGRIGTLACGTGSCEAVQFSPYAQVFGVEVSLIGLLGYLVLVACSIGAVQAAPGQRTAPVRALFVLSGLGVAFSLYLTGIELFVLHAICRWCVGSALIITLIFLCALLDRRRTAR